VTAPALQRRRSGLMRKRMERIRTATGVRCRWRPHPAGNAQQGGPRAAFSVRQPHRSAPRGQADRARLVWEPRRERRPPLDMRQRWWGSGFAWWGCGG